MSFIYEFVPKVLPFEVFNLEFMQKAFVGLVILSLMTALMGVQVVNFRMSFFADAISHSIFAGVAIGLLLAIDPYWTMPVFSVFLGLLIVLCKRRSSLASDTVIGVFFSAVIAFGLAVLSRDKNMARNTQQFLYGDILTIGSGEILAMFLLLIVLVIFQGSSYNRMLYLGFNETIAKVHGVKVAVYQYLYAGLLSVVIVFSIWAVGVLLVTAMLIIPAASARNFSKTAGGIIWWSILVSITSAITGLLISAQDWARTATGATIVLVAFVWFVVSTFINHSRHQVRVN